MIKMDCPYLVRKIIQNTAMRIYKKKIVQIKNILQNFWESQ